MHKWLYNVMHDPGLLQFMYTMHLLLGSSTIDLFFNVSTAVHELTKYLSLEMQ